MTLLAYATQLTGNEAAAREIIFAAWLLMVELDADNAFFMMEIRIRCYDYYKQTHHATT